MEKEICGLSNVTLPIIKSMLPVQLSRFSIRLGFCDTFKDNFDNSDFLLVDGEKFLKNDYDSLFVRDLIKEGKPVYALLLKKDYRMKLDLLNHDIMDCFDYPVMSDILSKTIRNQLLRYSKPPIMGVIKDSGVSYSVRGDNSENKNVFLEFMPSKSNQWFLRYKAKAISVSRFEKRIIEYLVTTKKLVSKKEIAYVGWETFDIKDNTIVVTIKKIRDHFHKLKAPVRIRNLYGFGYSIDILR